MEGCGIYDYTGVWGLKVYYKFAGLELQQSFGLRGIRQDGTEGVWGSGLRRLWFRGFSGLRMSSQVRLMGTTKCCP